MLTLGGIDLGQEGKDIVYVEELSGLADLLLVILLGAFHHSLPDVLGKHLVGVSCICQFAVSSGFCDFFVSMYSVIYVPGALCQSLVSFLDLPYSSVCPINCVAAHLSELPQVVFGLPLVPNYGSDPDRGVGMFYCLFWRWAPVSDLE